MTLPQSYKLIFFVPSSHLPACKTAVFAAGAGRYPALTSADAGAEEIEAKYTECSFQTYGRGQFRPARHAAPAIGTRGELEEVEEVKVEVLCRGREVVRRAIQGLITVHPYEVPVYEVYKIEDEF